jgi:hypothetical protein
MQHCKIDRDYNIEKYGIDDLNEKMVSSSRYNFS